MKIEDFGHSVALHVFEVLAREHSYVVPEQTRKAVIERVKADLATLIPKPSS